MGAPKSAVTKAIARMHDEAQAQDLRRQKQITNQIEIIDRLMDGATFDGEMARLVETLSATQAELDAVKAENADLRASQAGG